MDVRRGGPFPIAQTNRFSAAVRKLLSIKGEDHAVGFGVHLEDERPEHSFIKGERRWAQFNSATSAAGTLPVLGVRNPANSGVLGVITSIFFDSSAAATFNLESFAGPGTGFIPALGAMFATDTRWGGVATTLIAGGGAQAAYGGHIVTQVVSPGGNAIIDLLSREARVHPIILRPDSELVVVGNAVGVNTLNVTICGYERTLESGELIP